MLFSSAIDVFFFKKKNLSEVRSRNFQLFCWSLISSKLVLQVTETSEKMALSLDQLTGDRKVLEAQVSRAAPLQRT